MQKKKKNTKVSTHIFKDFIYNFIYQKIFTNYVVINIDETTVLQIFGCKLSTCSKN